MRTVVVGNRKLARHILRRTIENGWNVVGAIAPEGRLATEQANFAPLEDVVEGQDCRVHRTDDINSERTIEWLASQSPNVCISGGWSQIVAERVLEIPSKAFLGFHSSKLPKGRGGAPVNWSLIEGVEEVWLSLFHYTCGVDAGNVVAQESVSVEERDDVATVFDALAVTACDMLESVRNDLGDGDIDGEPQSLSNATYRPRRQPQDGLIKWEREPGTQFNWIRAQTDPYPGAYTFHDGTRLAILQGEPLKGKVPMDARVGEVVEVVDGVGINVRSGDGLFCVMRVRPGNGPPQWADRYAADAGITPGDLLDWSAAPESWYYTGIAGPDDPTNFETNLAVGESGRVELVALSGSIHCFVQRVELNDKVIFENSVSVDPIANSRVEYTPVEPGIHTVRVTFEKEGDRVDTRFLKVFVH